MDSSIKNRFPLYGNVFWWGGLRGEAGFVVENGGKGWDSGGAFTDY
jgi:hypothetical protein